MSPAKVIVNQVIIDFERRPEDFKCHEHVIEDKKAGFEYWIGNSFFNIGIYQPYKMSFGFIQGWRFHRALLKWKAADHLRKSNTLPSLEDTE